MHRRSSTSSRIARSPLAAARLAFVYLTLAAFGFQSYVAQTHIHLTGGEASALSKQVAGHKRSPENLPNTNDPANCPICQEVLHAGQFVMPSAAALLRPSLPVSIARIAIAIPAPLRAPLRGWESRAPPAF